MKRTPARKNVVEDVRLQLRYEVVMVDANDRLIEVPNALK